MSTVSGRVIVDIAIREVLANNPGVQSGLVNHAFQRIADLANGTADGQINKVYSKVETGIGASTTTNYDLAGSLTDRDGATLSFAEVTFILLVNLSTTAANVVNIGPGSSNGFGVLASNKGFWNDATDRNCAMADGEGMVLLWSRTGVPVTAGTGDILSVITQSATSANTWLIMIGGRNA